MPRLPKGLSLEDVQEAAESDESLGYCLACGERAEGVEPDAEKYECEECGEAKVYGAEQIILLCA